MEPSFQGKTISLSLSISVSLFATSCARCVCISHLSFIHSFTSNITFSMNNRRRSPSSWSRRLSDLRWCWWWCCCWWTVFTRQTSTNSSSFSFSFFSFSSSCSFSFFFFFSYSQRYQQQRFSNGDKQEEDDDEEERTLTVARKKKKRCKSTRITKCSCGQLKWLCGAFWWGNTHIYALTQTHTHRDRERDVQ